MANPSAADFLDLLRCPISNTPLTISSVSKLCSATGISYNNSEKAIPMLIRAELPSETIAQQRHYEKITGIYQKNLTFPHTKTYHLYLDDALDKAITHANLDGGNVEKAVVAEICCGYGEVFQLYKNRISRGVGVDISLSMLHGAIANEYGKHIIFVQGDALALPLADNSFDIVFLLGAIHHISDRKSLYEELWRILKPGGMIVVREPLDDFFLWRWLRKIIYTVSPALDAVTEHPLRKRDEVIRLEKAGFILGDWSTHGFLAYCFFMNSDVLKFNALFRHIPGIKRITRWAASFDSLVLKMPGLRNAGTQVVFRASKASQ